jgi:hypothetical protein
VSDVVACLLGWLAFGCSSGDFRFIIVYEICEERSV